VGFQQRRGSAAPSQVVWTAPSAATVDISGNVWLARNIQRAVNWSLLVNGVLQDSGSLFDGDAFSRASPDAFALASVSLQQGDTLALSFVTASQFGEFVGVNLAIDGAEAALAPVPEPATLLLWGTTLVGVGVVRRLRHRRHES
jgi:hypothetical protein